MQRVFGIVFGLATQGLFLVTVWQLFRFLHADIVSFPAGSMAIDLLLALQFAVPHSLLLHPKIRKMLSRWISPPFYGCFFCQVTCACLLILISSWRTAGSAVWRLSGASHLFVELAFFASWAGLFYSLYLSGLGYQTGFTPWWFWFRKQPSPAREFQIRSLYRVLRHPIYLCFLGLLWFNPAMTIDRFLLASVWTVYIFVGSYLKDERLAYYLQDKYRSYQQQVPGYPMIPFGPLARRRVPLPRAEPSVARSGITTPT